jgi:Protein of unknown function (DUF3830)
VSRQIEIEVEGARATLTLLEDWAPKTTAALWDVLPLQDQLLRHGKLSGDAVFVVVEDPRFKDLPAQNELPVTSIYKGYMVANLHPERSSVEFLISYGLAEYRWPDGRRYVTPVAEIDGDGDELYNALRRTWTEGAKKISFRRKA